MPRSPPNALSRLVALDHLLPLLQPPLLLLMSVTPNSTSVRRSEYTTPLIWPLGESAPFLSSRMPPKPLDESTPFLSSCMSLLASAVYSFIRIDVIYLLGN
ncbi:hypothetical protein ABZP36_003591 [Zizania latifolia]